MARLRHAKPRNECRLKSVKKTSPGCEQVARENYSYSSVGRPSGAAGRLASATAARANAGSALLNNAFFMDVELLMFQGRQRSYSSGMKIVTLSWANILPNIAE